MRWVTRGVVAALAIASAAISLAYGVKTAGGSDSFGYLSQAYLWLEGALAVHYPATDLGDLPFQEMLLAPLAYVPGAVPGTLVPTYPPGLPLLMAGALAVFGTLGPFLVAPASAALLIVATFVLGSRIEDTRAGLLAAVLVACSPAVVYQNLWPMSDVPAAAMWTMCLAAALGPGLRAPIAAGALAGAAILIRPNLAPLALIGALFLWTKRPGRPARTASLTLYALAAAPSVVLLAWFNNRLYGSPFASGYGDVGQFYSWKSIGPNLVNYPSWFAESQGILLAVLVVYGWARAFVNRSLRPLAVFSAVVVASYLPYLVFDAWWYLRFLLPAYPALFVVTASAGLAALGGRRPAIRRGMAVAALVLAMGHALWFIQSRNPFALHRDAHRFAAIGAYVRRFLPENAAFISMQHSGSLRYYAGRLTLRYDWILPGRLPFARLALENAGYDVYVLVDEGEEIALRRRFTYRGETAFLDRGPQFELLSSPRVRVYRLSDEGGVSPWGPTYVRPGKVVPIPPALPVPNTWEPPAPR